MSMAVIRQQLSALLGREVKQIRKTDERPSRVSVIDVIFAVTGKDKNQAGEDFRRLAARYPDVKANCFNEVALHPDVNSVGVHVEFPDSRGNASNSASPSYCAQPEPGKRRKPDDGCVANDGATIEAQISGGPRKGPGGFRRWF